MLEIAQDASLVMFGLVAVSKSLVKTGRAPLWITASVWVSVPVTMFPKALKAGVTTYNYKLCFINTRFVRALRALPRDP